MRTLLRSTLAVTTALLLVTATSVVAATGGRVDLTSPIRVSDTRSEGDGSRVTFKSLGSGALTVTVAAPLGPGSALIHRCSDAAAVGEATFRFSSAGDTQYATVATAEDVCISSTVPVHVIVDRRGTVTAAPEPTSDQYVPLPTPVTLVDEATSADNQTLHVDRPTGLSVGATAAILSIEVLAADDVGYVTARSCNGPMLVADLNFGRRREANVAYVELGPTDDICVYVHRPAHVRVKLLGELNNEGPNPSLLPPSWRYVPGEVPAPSLHAITPERVLDTRIGLGRPGTSKVAPDEVVELDFGDLVTPQTTAVVLNLTAVSPESGGFVTAWPCGGDRPTVSNLNFRAGDTVPNLVVSKLGIGGTVCVSGTSRTHLLADVSGTFEADGGLLAQPVTPDRILDTRFAVGTPATTKLAAGSTLELQVTGGDVPAGAGAATVNVTAAAADDGGYLTVYPCGQDRPTASNLNYTPGGAVANLVTAKLSSDGRLCIFASATTHVIADLAAWYGVDRPAGLVELAPERFLDTRFAVGVPTTTKIPGGRVVTLQVAGVGDVPNAADAVVMNVTAVAPEDGGFVTAWPCDASMPTVSNLNYGPSETTPNLATVKLSAAGTVCLFSVATTHLLADVAGYLTSELVEGQELVLE